MSWQSCLSGSLPYHIKQIFFFPKPLQYIVRSPSSGDRAGSSAKKQIIALNKNSKANKLYLE